MNRSIILVFSILLLALVMPADMAYAQSGQGSGGKQLHNYDNANGQDAHGGINRHGGDFAGEGGKHGPFGPGPDDDVPPQDSLNLTGEESTSEMMGEIWRKCLFLGISAQSGVLAQNRKSQ